MNKTIIFVMVGIYIVIFGGLYIYFDSTSQENDNSGSWKEVKDVLNEVRKDFFGKVQSVDIDKPLQEFGEKIEEIDLKKRLKGTSCSLEKEMDCVLFLPNKDTKEILFSIKNKINSRIILTGLQITGEINCNHFFDRIVHPDEEFYIKLEDCIFNGTSANIIINYYHESSSSDFSRSVKGNIIVK